MTKVKRLLNQFSPTHYDVTFIPNADELTFSGQVTIEGDTPEDGPSLFLHANRLNITKANIDGKPATVGEQSKHHEVELTIAAGIPKGNHQIYVEFEGEITRTMVGLYPSDFEHHDNQKRLIATQFEANHAREAFPCIDEPEAKATFQLTLVSKQGEVAISNTPLKSESIKGDLVTSIFEKTPRMSSYLLAFVTGEMHSVERKAKNGTVIKSWSSVGQETNKLDYSADEAVKILDFYEDFYGVPYPLEKCDLVALPDFDAGAMENWGIITFREIALLADPDNRSISSEQYVSLVVAHELAHMWFGNLVTMKWWDDLWLNESFASIMEHIALDAVHPDWNQWEHYASMDIISTTSRDIHKDIQPISIELDDPELIETLFDPGIVYTKGARLLKMMIEYVGIDAFKQGLRQYFAAHKFNNADRHDLWKAINDASGKDVDKLMTAWLDQPGMPVLSIDQQATSLAVSQKRFIVDGTTDDSIWPVPLLADQEIEPSILSERDSNIELPIEQYVTINHNASGHFISNYIQSDHLEYVSSKVIGQSLDASARINFLNDQLLLSRAGTAPLTQGLDVVSKMAKEDRYSVWAIMSRVISSAQQLTEGNEEAKNDLKLLRKNLASSHFGVLGTDDNIGDDPNTVQMRSMIFSYMLAAEDSKALQKAQDLLKTAGNPINLPSESRALILSALVRDGNEELVDQLSKLYAKTDAEMQLDIVSALSSTKSSEVGRQLLSVALGKKGYVRAQDVMRWLALFMRNHYIRDVSWEYMVKNWDWIEETLMQSKSFDYLPTYCAAVVSTKEMAEKYRELFEPLLSNKVLERNINIGLADIDTRVKWRSDNELQLVEWLQQYAKR